jgi:integrase
MSRAKPERIEIKDGNIVVPIYKFSDGRFCVDTMLGRTRKRITRASFSKAEVEARKLITQIASGRSHEVPLSISETEEYRLAKLKLAPFKMPLLAAIDEWISNHRRTGDLVVKNLPVVVAEFLAEKELEGIGQLHLSDRQSRLKKFAASFKGRIDRITATEVELWLKEIGGSRRTKSNYRNALVQLFRFARSKKCLPKNEPTVVDEVVVATPKDADIEIYTVTEMSRLLSHAPDRLVPFFVLGAFAGLRSQETMRLEWRDIRFNQNVIEVSAAKSKTASRRLVPILPVLKDWLWTLKKDAGRVMQYAHNGALCRARIKFCNESIKSGDADSNFTWKNNALRHSYASYRLAEVKDAARVALEMGNSPSMLFRNYRELVTEQEANDWFALSREMVKL